LDDPILNHSRRAITAGISTRSLDTMKTSSRGLLLVVAVACLGLWGCAQNKAGSDAAAKLRELEARHAKLEEDYQAVAAANETIRKRLAVVEADRQVAVRERDELKRQVTVRTGERDAVHAQLVQFGRDLQTLVGRVEAATNGGSSAPATSLTDLKTN
jgi:outer membrane murein-binding lipoprotein Lpp